MLTLPAALLHQLLLLDARWQHLLLGLLQPSPGGNGEPGGRCHGGNPHFDFGLKHGGPGDQRAGAGMSPASVAPAGGPLQDMRQRVVRDL